MTGKPRKRDTYQHGDLPNALFRAVLELVERKGVRNFSLAEAARLSGVSSGAPYRHFINREQLIADVSAGVYRDLVSALRTAREQSDQASPLAAVAAAYVAFAVGNRPGVELLFQAGVRHGDHPALAALDSAAYDEFRAAADAVGVSSERAHDLVFAAAAIAHGYATLQVVASASYAMSGDIASLKAGEAVERIVAGFRAG